MNRIISIALLLLMIWAPQQSVSPDLIALAESERAFARYSVAHNAREAFLKFFAEDGINFAPHPVKTREDLAKRPAPPSPSPAVLNWSPITGDISSAGDLGYTTGPFTVTARAGDRPPQHGMYFSVWRKEPDGVWRVVLDVGIQTPEAVAPLNSPFVPARASASAKRKGKIKPEAERQRVLALESEFFSQAVSSAEAAYQKHLSGDARMHRQQMMPMVGKSAIEKWLASEKRTLTGGPIDGGISRSADLAYVYGSYELKGAAEGGKVEKGYYARVWRFLDGRWQIVAEITNPLPQ